MALKNNKDNYVHILEYVKSICIFIHMRLSHIVKQILENVEYRGYHKAPNKERGVPLHDLTQIYPDDIYSDKADVYYGDRSSLYSDKESINIMKAAKGQPDKTIRVYRAVPNTLEDAGINGGDWVTANKKYAIQHGESTLSGEYKVISKDVPAKHLYTDANSIHEFGYDPS